MSKQEPFQGMTPEDAAFVLLAQVCRVDTETLLKTFDSFDYTPRRKKKRSGGYRYYFVPHDNLKNIQVRLLKHFFYQLDRRGWYDQHQGSPWLERKKYFPKQLHGFIKNRSYVDNAKRHTEHFTRFVLRMDLKNAFPSITKTMVEGVLRKLITREVRTYWQSVINHERDKECMVIIKKVLAEVGQHPHWNKSGEIRDENIDYFEVEDWQMRLYELFEKHDPGNVPWNTVYEQYPLFPARRCKEFRELIRFSAPAQELDEFTKQVIDSFIALVLELVTYRDTLVQGSPTSGFLFMLFLRHTNIVSDIEQSLFNRYHLHRTLSIYADDITIGFEERPTREIIESITALIEKHGFKINHKKTKVWDRRQIAPVITGVRLIRKKHTGESINKFIELRKSKDCHFSGAMQRKREGGVWYEDTISIPQKLQRKMRAIFYQGATLPEVSQKLHDLIAGHKGMIIQVYGGFLHDVPKSIAKPLRMYLERFGKMKKM
jgi:hypothetical protein